MLYKKNYQSPNGTLTYLLHRFCHVLSGAILTASDVCYSIVKINEKGMKFSLARANRVLVIDFDCLYLLLLVQNVEIWCGQTRCYP